MGGGKSGKLPLTRTRSYKRVASNINLSQRTLGRAANGGIAVDEKTSTGVGRIYSNNPEKSARQLFSKISRGGRIVHRNNPKRTEARFKKATVTFRPKSQDGSSVVEFHFRVKPDNLPRSQKIHFMKEKE